MAHRFKEMYPRGCMYSLMWPIWEYATRQGMVFVLSVLNRVYILCESVIILGYHSFLK